MLLFDSSPRLDLESLHVQALELGLRRAGFRTLLLAFDLPPERIVRAIRAIDPTAFVFCGGEATLEVVGRLVYTVRQVGSAGPVFEYREAMPVTGEHGIPSLGSRPSEAVERLKAYVDSGRLEQVVVAPEVEPAAPAAARVPVAPLIADAAGSAGCAPTMSGRPPAAPSIARGCRPSSSAIPSPIARCRPWCAPRPRVRRRLAAELERAGVSAAGLLGARGAHHRRRRARAADAAPPLRLEQGQRHRGHRDARGARPRGAPPARRRTGARSRSCSPRTAARWWSGVFPEHAERVSQAFDALDDGEKRSLAELCRKLAA